MKVVIHPAVEEFRLARLRAAATGAELVNAATRAEALDAMPGADAFLGKITAPLLAEADRLRWVQAFTVSLEHYLFPELVEHPCTLTNMRGLFGDVIADQVIGYVLCFARNLHTYIRQQAEHRYEPVGGESARVNNASGPGTVNAMDRATIYLPKTTMGIVGLGAIGREIARRARAFGMTVVAVDRHPERILPFDDVTCIWGLDGLDSLLHASDFVVIAAPHTPETAGLFDAALFERTKVPIPVVVDRPTGPEINPRASRYLINIGRGAIVVLDDLVRALREGWLDGAALDVFEEEPLPADHPLWDLPNVILTPHTAGYSPVIAERHLEVLVENLGRFHRGEALINVADKSAWY